MAAFLCECGYELSSRGRLSCSRVKRAPARNQVSDFGGGAAGSHAPGRMTSKPHFRTSRLVTSSGFRATLGRIYFLPEGSMCPRSTTPAVPECSPCDTRCEHRLRKHSSFPTCKQNTSKSLYTVRHIPLRPGAGADVQAFGPNPPVACQRVIPRPGRIAQRKRYILGL